MSLAVWKCECAKIEAWYVKKDEKEKCVCIYREAAIWDISCMSHIQKSQHVNNRG